MNKIYKHNNLVNQKGGFDHSRAGVARDRLFLCQNKRTVPELKEKSGILIEESGTTYDPNSAHLSPFELSFIILIPKHIAKHLAPKMDDQRRFIPEFQQWIEFPSQGRIIFTVRTVEIKEQIGDQKNLQFRPVETEKNAGKTAITKETKKRRTYYD